MSLIKEENTQENTIINRHEFRVVGMSRSGNHAVINWIIKQLHGKYCFLNCAEPKTNPYYTARPFQLEELEKTFHVNYPGFDLAAEQKGNFSKKDYLIYSYEDCFLGMLKHKAFEHHHDAFVGPSKQRLDILILRDPFNLFASRKKSGLFSGNIELSSKPVTPLTAKRIWKQHAREAIGEKRHLGKNRIFINYNRWAKDAEYRQELIRLLGLSVKNNSIAEVSEVAGGSSFDGLKFNNSGNKMEILERWKHYMNDPDYQKFFDEEMIRLSHKIFGSVPAEFLISC